MSTVYYVYGILCLRYTLLKNFFIKIYALYINKCTKLVCWGGAGEARLAINQEDGGSKPPPRQTFNNKIHY